MIKKQIVNQTWYEKAVMDFLKVKFKNPELFEVVSEKRKYRPIMTGVWNQYQDRAPEVCEIYFGGKYLCDVNSSEQPELCYRRISWLIAERIKNGG